MYNFCQQNAIKLIIIDILRKKSVRSNGTIPSFSPSSPPSLLQTLTDCSDVHIDSYSLLADYAGVAELYNSHGAHISEFTHTLIGIVVAKKIDSLLQNKSWEKQSQRCGKEDRLVHELS